MPNNRITEISVCLARLYFAVLLEHVKIELGKTAAKRSITIRYGELVRRTREKYPDAPYIEAAISINIGRRLLVVEMICKRLGLPNLACLAVNAKGQPGKGYTGHWAADKAAVLAFDWDAVSADVANAFDMEAQAARTPPNNTRRNEEEARELLWQDYKAARARYDGKFDHDTREAMVKLLISGLSIDEAFDEAVEVE